MEYERPILARALRNSIARRAHFAARPKKPWVQHRAWFKERLADGWSCAKIGREIGVSGARVRQILRELWIPK